jgi:hypothetical protein
LTLVGLVSLSLVGAAPLHGERLDGFNIVMAEGHPFGSASTGRSLLAAKQLGATTVAIIPFLWQATPSSAAISRGTDMPDDMLRQAIRQARGLGFSVAVKPHVWVPQSWAGAVEPDCEQAWATWFAQYRGEIARIARIAAEERADMLVVGTELAKTTHRPEWTEVIAEARAVYPGILTYVGHNLEEAEAMPFWALLDTIGVSLYPPLGDDEDRVGRRATMQVTAERLDALSNRMSKPVIVGEIGLRSAAHAAAKPWESAEERDAAADGQLQANVLADWLTALDRPAVRGVLIWRWFTDPAAGGPADTDFTVQGKPAEAVLRCAWTAQCR